MDYTTIKQLAKQLNCKVTDLIALAPQNDPFYVGTSGDWINGQWFASLWQHFGYTTGVHTRRVHYHIISQKTVVRLPNGTPYENTESCWNFLVQASKLARYLELVDPAAFADRRNPDPAIFALPTEIEPIIEVWNDLWEAPTLPEFPDLPGYRIEGYIGQQDYHIEIWCEKSTMNDILLPLCRRYGINLQTGLGEMSITATLALAQRLKALGKPSRIFYVSDFDPAGEDMPVSVSRKLERFIRSLSEELDVRLFQVALNAKQVHHFQLPRTPIKETERRRGAFEDRYGAGAVELDALEAVHPGELARMISYYIERYYDIHLPGDVQVAYDTLAADLENQRQAIIARHQDEIDRLRAEYARLRAETEARITHCTAQMTALWQTIANELTAAMPDVYDYPIPQAEPAIELGEGLYNSERSYLEQLVVYKRHQGKSVPFTL
jgi:hypothetical protein